MPSQAKKEEKEKNLFVINLRAAVFGERRACEPL